MRFSAHTVFAAALAVTFLWWGGCSSSKTEAGPDGGSGGVSGSGGGLAGTGGLQSGSGGSNVGSGGVVGSGGAKVGTGGAVATGGSRVGSGGGPGGIDAGPGGSSGGSHGIDGGPGGGGGTPAGLLNPDYTTTWNPGILADTPTGQPLGSDGLPVRTTICSTAQLSDAAKLQTILNGCAAGSVVQLLAGTYTVSSTIYVPSGVVLRGQASSGTNATIIALATSGTGPVLAIGPKDLFDQTCYNNSNYTTSVVDLTADAAKEQNQLSIAAKNTTFAAGDFALVDQAAVKTLARGTGTLFGLLTLNLRSNAKAI